MRFALLLLTVIWCSVSGVTSKQYRRAREIDRISLLQSESYQTMESTILLLSSLQLPVICESVSTDPEAARATVADLLFFALDVVKSQEMVSDEVTADDKLTTSLPHILTTVLVNQTNADVTSQPQSQTRMNTKDGLESSAPISSVSEIIFHRRLIDASDKDYLINSEFRRTNRQQGEKNDDDNSIHIVDSELKEMPETRVRVDGSGNTATEIESHYHHPNTGVPTLTGVLHGWNSLHTEGGRQQSVGVGSTVPSYWFPLHWVYRTSDRYPSIPYQSEREANSEHDNSTNTRASVGEVSGDSGEVTQKWQSPNTTGRVNNMISPEAGQIEVNSNGGEKRVKANVSDTDGDVSSKRPAFKTKYTDFYRNKTLDREELSKTDETISGDVNIKQGISDNEKADESLNAKLENVDADRAKTKQNDAAAYRTPLAKTSVTSAPIIKIGSEKDIKKNIKIQPKQQVRQHHLGAASRDHPRDEYELSEEEYYHWNTLDTDHDWEDTETDIDESSYHVRPRQQHDHGGKRRGDIPIEPREHNAAAQDRRWQEEEEMRCHSVFGFYEDPLNCQKFYICSWGSPYHFDCAPGTLWNSKLTVCDWPRNVECGSRPWYLKNNAKHIPFKAT